MEKEERKMKLKTIVGHLVMKRELTSQGTHICFNIKPEDVIYIFNEYKDVLESSNLYISRSSYISSFSFNSDKFKVSTGNNSIFIESLNYEQKNNFNTYIHMRDVSEIEIDISCETILSFHFNHSNLETSEQYSFRND